MYSLKNVLFFNYVSFSSEEKDLYVFLCVQENYYIFINIHDLFMNYGMKEVVLNQDFKTPECRFPGISLRSPHSKELCESSDGYLMHTGALFTFK